MGLRSRLTWVELKLFGREPISLVFTFAFPLAVLLVLFGVFGSTPTSNFEFSRPDDYYLASYMAVVIAAVSLVALPVHVASYRERGVLRRLRASSVPATAVIVAQVVVALLLVITGATLLVLAGLALYDTNLPQSPAQVALGFTVAAVSFLALGFLIGFAARTARAAQAVGMLAFLPMWLLSGAGPPDDVMSDTMQTVAELLPLTYAVRAVRDPWLGHGTNGSALLVLTGVLAGAAAIATWQVRRI